MSTGKHGSYRYFILGNTVPVRVAYNAQGLKIGAERPDGGTGALKIDHLLMSRLERSWEVEEIDAERFEQLRRASTVSTGNPMDDDLPL